MRQKSNIIVKVLDFTNIKTSAYEHISSQLVEENDIIGLADNGPFGLVETKKGTFIINHLGYGTEHPITENSPGPIIELYLALNNGAFISPPAIKLQISARDLDNLEYEKEVPLDEFISHLTENQEANFRLWHHTFNKLGPIFNNIEAVEDRKQAYEGIQVECPLIRSKGDLKKYGSFLSPEVCDCEKKEPLVEVVGNVCCREEPHLHCKHCGKII